jgi:hypothetical protein
MKLNGDEQHGGEANTGAKHENPLTSFFDEFREANTVGRARRAPHGKEAAIR